MRDWFPGLNGPGRRVSPPAVASPITVSAAVTAAQERWAAAMGTRLTGVEPSEREVISEQLKHAGSRAGLDFTVRFAERAFSSAFWSGVVFASAIGVVLWGARIPSRHAAATTAAAYLVIVLVAAPPCRSHTRRILNTLGRISGDARRNFLKVYLPALAAAAILYCIANTSAFNSAASPQDSFVFYLQEFGAFAIVTVLGFGIAYLALAYSCASALGEPLSNETIGWAGALAATAFTIWRPVMRDSLGDGNRYLDSGVLRVLSCAVTISELGGGQALPDSRAIKSVIFDLELAAADIQQYAVSRVPRTDTATRRLAHLDGLRLASVIRDTKAPVARAVHPRDYATAASTLTDFLQAWARPGQHDFADKAQGDPAVSRYPWLRRAAARVWSAVLLAAGGIFLPLLPIYSHDHAAAGGLRYALLTAAVLALAAQGSPATDIIERNLEKTLPGQAG